MSEPYYETVNVNNLEYIEKLLELILEELQKLNTQEGIDNE